MRPIVELGDVVVNFGSERPLVVIGGSELSLGRGVGLSDETTGARSLGTGVVTVVARDACVVGASAGDEAAGALAAMLGQ